MKKKLIALAACAALAMGLVACTTATEEVVTDAQTEAVEATEAQTEAQTEEVEIGVPTAMSYAEYMAAEVDTEVTLDVFVQATQSWYNGAINVYAADEDGGYYFYNMTCSEEDAALLTEGTEILVTGYKSEWSGEIELAEGATFSFVEGGTSYVAETVDVTEFVGTDTLADYMNQKVSFTDMTVEAVSYKGGEPGDDIYVTLSKDGTNVEFCLEYYLNGSDEDFYNTVGNLEEGATVDVECFLYWYEGADGHLTAVTVK